LFYYLSFFFLLPHLFILNRKFKKAFNDVVLSRRAIRNLNNMYPTVNAEELRTYADTICIICREEMSGDNQVKKLPCDHIFHKNCLRSWFQRQQTCPTCRTQVLRINPLHHHHHHQPQAANQQQQQPVAPVAPAQPPPVAAPVQQQQPIINQQPQQIINDLPQQQHQPSSNLNINPAQLFNSIGHANIMPPFSKLKQKLKQNIFSSLI
jgi:E3 ubiquitin-protein ligase synoviolin